MELLALPQEIQLLVALNLDVPDILTLRQTCKSCLQLTLDESIWVNLLDEQKTCLPVDPQYAPGFGSALPTGSELERAVKLNHYVARQWTRTRRSGPVILPSQSHRPPLIGLKILEEKWLVCVYYHETIQIWDLDNPSANSFGEGHPPATLLAQTTFSGRFWTGFAAAIEGDAITVALTSITMPSVVSFCKVSLVSKSVSPLFKLELDHHGGPIRYMDLEHQALLLIDGTTLSIVNYFSLKRQIWLVPQGINTDVYEGVLDARFFGPYVLVVTSRAIFLVPFDPSVFPRSVGTSPTALDPVSDLKCFEFLGNTFRSVTFSGVARRVHASESRETSAYSITLMAYDISQGLASFTLTCTLSSDSNTPRVEISNTGLYSMANTDAPLLSPFPPEQASQYDQLHTPTPTPTIPSSLQGFSNPSTRGFISTFSMGLQGKRAFWVERQKGNTIRKIHVWDVNLPPSQPSAQQPIMFPPLSSQRVYAINSYDLKEDKTHCALAESTGRMVLGDRAGRIHILDLN